MKTKVTFTWNLASEQPIFMTLPVLASTQNNKLIVFKNTYNECLHNSDWKRLVEKYKINYWVYQSEII